MEAASKTRRSRRGSEESSMVMDGTRGKEPAPMWRNRSWGRSSEGPVLQLAEGVIAHRECANGRTADANRLQLVEKEVLQFNGSRIHQLQVQSLQRTAVG